MSKNDLLLDENYFGLKAISKSQISLFKKSPVLFWRSTPFNDFCSNWQETDATVFGNLAHTLILEPENFNAKHFIVDFGTSRKNKVYKQLKQENEAKGEYRSMVTQKEVERAMKMQKAITHHRLCKVVLDGVTTEAPLVWKDSRFRNGFEDVFTPTNRLCKAKMDGMKIIQNNGDIIVVDYKTTALMEQVIRDPTINNYQIQCAMYNEGVRANFGRDIKKFLFIMQSSKVGEENIISVVELGPATFEAGRVETYYYLEEMDRLLSRVESGQKANDVFIHQREFKPLVIDGNRRYVNTWQNFPDARLSNPKITLAQHKERLKFIKQ